MILLSKNRHLLNWLFVVAYLLILTILLRSVILSGYYYRLNADEVYHANLVYLMLEGFKPYLDFYSTYSPFLQLYLIPAFLFFGSTVKAIAASRVMMIMLFLMQVFLWFLLVRRIFGKKVAFLFVPLFLMDPFMVFAGMQIRPENLMMVFFALSLLVFSKTVENVKNLRLFFFSGVLFAMTFLLNLKILPSLIAFGLVFVIYAFQNKLYRQLLTFTNGLCLTFFIFLGYFLFAGYLPEMFQGLFIDPYTLNKSIPNATWLGYFYFQNPTIFGIDGKPINWIYAWLLPVLGFAGGYSAIGDRVRGLGFSEKNEEGGNKLMKIILFVTLFLQWFSMLFITSVFIQYYIPLNWLYSVFTAYFLVNLIQQFNEAKILKRIVLIVLTISFFLLYQTSVKANLARSKMSDDPIIKEMNEFWRIVPENEKAFPNVPFRIPIYPVTWGGTFAVYIRDRYQPVHKLLDQHKLPKLVGLHDEYFSFLDYESQQYILTNYERDQNDKRIWRRK